MALLSWYETFAAGDCMTGHVTFNQMIDYIKHSACTDFTIYSTCTSSGQAFRFTQTGANSQMYGGGSTGDDLQILANDTDIYPYIKLLGDGDAEIWVANNDFLWFYEGGIKAIRFSADSNDSQIRGRDNTLGHLSLWANTIDAYPYIKLSGGGSIELHADLNDEIIFYEQANERFRFEEHQIDFNADRAIYINDDETYIGHGAGDNIGAGTGNTLIGHDAGQANNFSGCAFFGYEAGKNNTQDLIAGMGYQALMNNTGQYCAGLGYQVLMSNTGNANAGLGYQVLFNNTTGFNNTGVGNAALFSNTTGNNNTAIGRQAGFNTAVGISSCIYIGQQAGQDNAASNKLFINPNSSAFPLIYGEFDNDVVKFGNNSAAWNFQFTRNDDDSIIEGGTVAGDDLILKANSTAAYSAMTLHGGGTGGIDFDTFNDIIIYEQGTQMFKFELTAPDSIVNSGANNENIYLKPHGTGLVKWGTETTNAGSDRGKLIAMKTAAGTTVYLKTYDLV